MLKLKDTNRLLSESFMKLREDNMKNKCSVKKPFFLKNVIGESCVIICVLTDHDNLDLSLLTKWRVFFQNASRNPSRNVYQQCKMGGSNEISLHVSKPFNRIR